MSFKIQNVFLKKHETFLNISEILNISGKFIFDCDHAYSNDQNTHVANDNRYTLNKVPVRNPDKGGHYLQRQKNIRNRRSGFNFYHVV